MNFGKPTIKKLIFILLVPIVFFTSAYFSTVIRPRHITRKSAQIRVEYERVSTVSTEKASNTFALGGTLTTEYKCEQTTPTGQGAYVHRAEQDEQTKRRILLDKVCAEEGQGRATSLERRHFLLDRRRSILYCWIHKVASTSWVAFLAALRGRRVRPNRIYREIGRLAAASASEARSAASDYHIRFIVVRHPFSRLVSAYRDRIWAATRRFSAQAWTYVPRIFRFTRPSLFQSRSSVSILCNGNRTLAMVPTFEEFVRYLLNTASNHQSKGMLLEKHSEGIQPNISAESISAFDVHWVPYYQHCSICSIPYNTIIKLETIEKDTKYLMEKVGLSRERRNEILEQIDPTHKLIRKKEEKNKIQIKLEQVTSVEGFHKGLQKTEKQLKITGEKMNLAFSKGNNQSQCLTNQEKNCLQVTESSMMSGFNLRHLQVSNIGPSCPCYYFSQLTKAQLDGLRQIYEIDFKMFGYSTKEYESCVKQEKQAAIA